MGLSLKMSPVERFERNGSKNHIDLVLDFLSYTVDHVSGKFTTRTYKKWWLIYPS